MVGFLMIVSFLFFIFSGLEKIYIILLQNTPKKKHIGRSIIPYLGFGFTFKDYLANSTPHLRPEIVIN